MIGYSIISWFLWGVVVLLQLPLAWLAMGIGRRPEILGGMPGAGGVAAALFVGGILAYASAWLRSRFIVRRIANGRLDVTTDRGRVFVMLLSAVGWVLSYGISALSVAAVARTGRMFAGPILAIGALLLMWYHAPVFGRLVPHKEGRVKRPN